ncbi:hypothetical protein VULLAG_LOCUS12320 [Vulpes lagopus]
MRAEVLLSFHGHLLECREHSSTLGGEAATSLSFPICGSGSVPGLLDRHGEGRGQGRERCAGKSAVVSGPGPPSPQGQPGPLISFEQALSLRREPATSKAAAKGP